MRLSAIDAHLAGQSLNTAAAIAHRKPPTLRMWLTQLQTLGPVAALAKWEAPRNHKRPKLRADAARLRALAQSHSGQKTQRKLLALAFVVEGMPVPDAAIQTAVSECTIHDAIRRFRREGYAMFSSRRKLGRQVKLTPQQLEILRVIVHQNPGMSPDTLCARILGEFGVRYSTWGIENLLRKQLGIFRSMPSAQSPQTRV